MQIIEIHVSGRGGGHTAVYNNKLNCSLISLAYFPSSESLCFTVTGNLKTLCILIYRLPESVFGFLEQFSELLSMVMPNCDRVLIYVSAVLMII